MEKLLIFGLFGLLAQLIDGTLGMAYGVTSTTLLVGAGTAPAVASATVHLAEIGTTLASGTAHYKFGNVDWRTVGLLAVPGAIGAFFGAVVLSNLSAEVAEPWVATILFALGLYILIRFLRPSKQVVKPAKDRKPLPRIFLTPLGLVAGTVDAMGGGGWGPIGTPTLLSSGRMEPRKVIGSVDTSEFLVAIGASLGFLVALPTSKIDTGLLAAILIGGLIAAPIAAYLVKRLPARVLGAAVGGLILVTNTKTFGESVGIPDTGLVIAYIVFGAIWIGSIIAAVQAVRRERDDDRGGPVPQAA